MSEEIITRSFRETVELFLEKEKMAAYHVIEVHKRGIMDDFARFLDGVKPEEYSIDQLTEEDIMHYFYFLHTNEENNLDFKIEVLVFFLKFAFEMGWLRPEEWSNILRVLVKHKEKENGKAAIRKPKKKPDIQSPASEQLYQ
ncbi:MAG: hypothetical protein GY754_18800 [bacterium]|nr:hypothetical protein [bacterium]MCP4133022.1 hypothetical protein [bacterium]